MLILHVQYYESAHNLIYHSILGKVNSPCLSVKAIQIALTCNNMI